MKHFKGWLFGSGIVYGIIILCNIMQAIEDDAINRLATFVCTLFAYFLIAVSGYLFKNNLK